MLSAKAAADFAKAWIETWNSQDLDRMMSYCAEDCELVTAHILSTREAAGVIKGKENIRTHVAKAIARVPRFRFELLNVLIGVDTVVIYYRSVLQRLAAAVIFFDAEGKVAKIVTHFTAE